MKIEGSPKVGTPRASTGGGARAAAPAPAPTPQPAAQVDISGSAASLHGAAESFNASRVAEIRQAIAEGKFQINPERIADGLLASVRDMLTRR